MAYSNWYQPLGSYFVFSWATDHEAAKIKKHFDLIKGMDSLLSPVFLLNYEQVLLVLNYEIQYLI